MIKETKLAVESRNCRGSSVSRRLRRAGLLPGVINNSKGESQLVQLGRHDFEMLLRHHKSENLIFDVTVDKAAPRKVLLKEVQHDPLSGGVMHVDFVEISMTEKMRIRVPIRLLGEPVGVSQEGGILDHILRELEVECLPGDLVEQFEVDVAALKLGQSLKVGDLHIDPKFTVLADASIAVASVTKPREEEEVAPEEAAVEGAAAEPELIGRKKEEGEEGAEEGAAPGKAEEGKEKKEKGKPAAADKKAAGAKPAAGADKKAPAGGAKPAAGADKKAPAAGAKPAGPDKKPGADRK